MARALALLALVAVIVLLKAPQAGAQAGAPAFPAGAILPKSAPPQLPPPTDWS